MRTAFDFDERDIRAMRLEGGYREFVRVACQQAKDAAKQRRALVLRHEDIAKRLTEPPLNYTRPEQWNGSIPPELFNGVHNDSPLRPALLAIVADAETREA